MGDLHNCCVIVQNGYETEIIFHRIKPCRHGTNTSRWFGFMGSVITL